MRNTIDLKRATLILRALHIAVKNASRIKFGLSKRDMVREIPQYRRRERGERICSNRSERARSRRPRLMWGQPPKLAQLMWGQPPSAVRRAARACVSRRSRHRSCGDSRHRLSGRTGSIGPQRPCHPPNPRPRFQNAAADSANPGKAQATRPSSEGPKECSPCRKAWVAKRRTNSPGGPKRKSGERKTPRLFPHAECWA